MAADCGAADGYQIQTSSSRFVPGTGASVSNVAVSLQSPNVRPTVNGPVGVGRVSALLRSSQSDPSKAPMARRPKIASPAWVWRIFIDEYLCSTHNFVSYKNNRMI